MPAPHLMSPLPRRADLVIVGGGLAGLAAARLAAERGLDYHLLEASDRLGGRVATDLVDGFMIDRGFQVLLTSYPELARLGALDALELGRFEPGAYVRLTTPAGACFASAPDPWRRPTAALDLQWRRVFGVRDALRLARLRSGLRGEDPLAAGRSTIEYLEARGFSRSTITRFFRPFLGGVLLDRELGAPARFMRRLFAAFARGDAAIPAGGMGALPAAIARPLDPARVHLGAAVDSIEPGRVHLGDHTFESPRVLVATDGDAAARLLGRAPSQPLRWHATTSVYYTTTGPLPAPLHRPSLVLDGDGVGPLHHLAPLSSVTPSLGTGPLVVASHDGAADASLEPAMTAELARWFPGTPWRVVAVRPIQHALPAMEAEPTEPFLRVAPGLVVAGDHTWDRSIDGALFAGKAAADHLCSRA